MPKVLRLFLSVLLGLVLGGAVNMGLIMISGSVIPAPPGADVTTTEGLKASMHLFEAKHFVFPFLAHALGTLVGAFVAASLAPGGSAIAAFIVAGAFLLGGIAAVVMLPSPAWFNAIDLALAYLPAGWLGHRLAAKVRRSLGKSGT